MILLLSQVDTDAEGRNCHSAIRRRDVQSMIDLEIGLLLETAPPRTAGNKLQVENQVDWLIKILGEEQPRIAAP